MIESKIIDLKLNSLDDDENSQVSENVAALLLALSSGDIYKIMQCLMK